MRNLFNVCGRLKINRNMREKCCWEAREIFLKLGAFIRKLCRVKEDMVEPQRKFYKENLTKC